MKIRIQIMRFAVCDIFISHFAKRILSKQNNTQLFFPNKKLRFNFNDVKIAFDLTFITQKHY